MKDISDIIATPLTLLINQSLQSGIFPDKLKIAKVVPIFKAGKYNIDSYVHNYRPISLMSCFSKIFERVVYNQLYNHLQLNKLLYDSQYGFRKSHSTELAALELIDSIYKNLDQGVMNRLKHYLPQRILQILYNSLILSHLNSNITAWGFASHKLCRLQKRALRLITDSRYNAHTQPLFKALCTLTLDDTFKMQCLKFYYKCIQGKLPPFFDTFFIEKTTLHNYQTRRRNDLHFQTTHSSTAQNCIRYYIPKLLSTLPTRVKEKIHTHSYTGFCMYVKTYFVDQYNDSCSIIHCYICSN